MGEGRRLADSSTATRSSSAAAERASISFRRSSSYFLPEIFSSMGMTLSRSWRTT
jgi:hypothetical protein